jgi:hypothetical protein
VLGNLVKASRRNVSETEDYGRGDTLGSPSDWSQDSGEMPLGQTGYSADLTAAERSSAGI